MASDLHGFTEQEVLNKVLNTTSESFKVDIVSGAEYAEDSGHTTADTGNFVLGVRNDTLGTLGDASGDYVPFQMNASGALYVEVASTGTGGGVHVDDAGFTLGSHSGVMMMGFAGTQSVDANDAGAIAMETDGSIHIHDGGNTITVDGTVTANAGTNLNTSALSTHAKQDTMITHLGEIEGAVETIETAVGTDGSTGPAGAVSVAGTQSGGTLEELRVDSDGHLQVDVLSAASTAVTNAGTFAVQSTLQAADGVDIGNVDVASIVPGTAATNLGKAEDAVHGSGDTGVMALAVRNDDVAALGAADGDYAPLQVNAAGSLYTKDETGEAGSILVTGTGTVTTTVTANTVFVAIQFIEDSVFDSTDATGLVSATDQLYPSSEFTSTSIDADAGAVSDSVTFPQGMTIFGRWSGFKLASGKVIAYIAHV